MKTFTIDRPQGFRLAAAARFFAGFVPGSGMAANDDDTRPDPHDPSRGGAPASPGLRLSFRLDRTFEPVVVRLSETEIDGFLSQEARPERRPSLQVDVVGTD